MMKVVRGFFATRVRETHYTLVSEVAGIVISKLIARYNIVSGYYILTSGERVASRSIILPLIFSFPFLPSCMNSE